MGATVTSLANISHARQYVVVAVDAAGNSTLLSRTGFADNDLGAKGHANLISWEALAGTDRYIILAAELGKALGYIGFSRSLYFIDDNLAPDPDDAHAQRWARVTADYRSE